MTRAPSHRTIAPYLLSAREMEVAKALARNETVTAIAQAMGISSSAVGNYRRSAQEKLGVYNRFQLAAYAKEQGWEASEPKFSGDRCKCMACDLPFNSTAAFDMHRVGSYRVQGDRRCLTVTEMSERGMAENSEGFWVTKLRETNPG